MPSVSSQIILQLGHSPDPDDAFMWWPLFEIDGQPSRLDTGRFRFEPVTQDIETLNIRAEQAELEITALSCAQAARVADRYAITSCGASMGDHYGPRVVTKRSITRDDLLNGRLVVAIPGRRTSAFAALSLWLGTMDFRVVEVPFERIINEVQAEVVDAGLVIHEGQLTFSEAGLSLIVDLGQWWSAHTGLPLPLGVNAIRLDLEAEHGEGTLVEITGLLRRSVDYALKHRSESLEYARSYSCDTSAQLMDEFVSMYVNHWTLQFGPEGKNAVQRFLTMAHDLGVTCEPSSLGFIEPKCENTGAERLEIENTIHDLSRTSRF